MWNRIIDSGSFNFFYPVVLILSVLIGYYIAARLYTRKNINWIASGVESGVIGFFALLLSFTFASSGNLMKDRNDLVQQLADVTADLRRQSLFTSDTLKGQTKDYLVAYLDQLKDFNAQMKKDKAGFVKKVDDINGDFLSRLTTYGKESGVRQNETNQLLPHFNKMNSLFYHIMNSYQTRTPVLIIILIIVASWLIGLLIGFMNGFHKKRHYLVPALFIILVTLSVQTIRDMDNPAKGSIMPDYNNFGLQKQSLLNSTR